MNVIEELSSFFHGWREVKKYTAWKFNLLLWECGGND